MKANKKNISKKVPNGRTLQTRDEFLSSGKGKSNIKPDHPNKHDLYRRVGVVDSNNKDELAIVKLGTKGRHTLEDYLDGKSSYNAYIEIEDNKGNRIKIDGVRFVENPKERDLSKKQVANMRENALKNKETSIRLRKDNKEKLHKLKSRQ